MSGKKMTNKVYPNEKHPDGGTTASKFKADMPTEVMHEWAEITDWHCVNNVFKSVNPFSRLMWLVVVLLGSFFAYYQCGSLTHQYIYESSWLTSVTYETPPEQGLDWPNLTICGMDYLDYKSVMVGAKIVDPYEIAYAANMKMEEGVLFYKRYQATVSNGLDENQTVWMAHDEFEEQMRAFSNSSLRTLITKYSPTCEETVLHCGLSDTFALHKDPYNCCGVYYAPQKTGCFSMQLTRAFNKSTKKIGSDNAGIYLLLDPRIRNYYDKLTLDVPPSAGFRIYFHFGALDAVVPDTVLVSPGTHTLVTLVAEKHVTVVQNSQILPFYETARGCVENYTYHHVLPDGEYSRQLCQTDCWITIEIREQNCTLSTTRLKKRQDCTEEQVHASTFQAMLNDTQKLNKTYADSFNLYECLSACQEGCMEMKVDAKISQAQFPAPPKADALVTYMNRAFNKSSIKYTREDVEGLIFLEMYYKSIEWRVVKKMEKTTIGQFVSNIGGALGVWTGLSLTALLQAFVYWMDFLIIWLKRVIRRKLDS